MTVLSVVPAPTADAEIQASVVNILEEALAAARDGKISAVVVIALHPDSSWSEWQSATDQLSQMIGRLEIAKHKRLKQFLENE